MKNDKLSENICLTVSLIVGIIVVKLLSLDGFIPRLLGLGYTTISILFMSFYFLLIKYNPDGTN